MKTRASKAIHLLLILASSTAAGQTPTPTPPRSTPTGPVIHVEGTATNLDRIEGETISVDILRWSSDAERERLLEAYSQGEQQASDVLRNMESAGYIWRSGSGLGKFVKYAYRGTLPDGREQIVIVSDDDFGEWSRKPGLSPQGTMAPPITLFELRLPAKGPGEGRWSPSAKMGAHPNTRTLALGDFASAPVVVKNVTKRMP